MLEKLTLLLRDYINTGRKDRELNAMPDIITAEEEAWKSVLGAKFEIPPVPEYLKNPLVNEKLKSLKMQPVYIPPLHLGTPGDLKSWDEKKFIDEMSQKYFYPDWKRYESLTKKEKNNHGISRNLNEWYWKEVKKGNIDFPKLKDGWKVVEILPKPSIGKKYPDSAVTKVLGFTDRFNVSWNDAAKAMKEKKSEILLNAGLPDNCEIRLPEALEWNLLANRFGWGGTDSYEWTNTIHRLEKFSLRLVIGSSQAGGSANIPPAGGLPELKHNFVGFRILIDLPRVPA